MPQDELFASNLKRWALFCPEMEDKVRNLECQRVFIVPAENNDINFAIKEDGETRYFHSMQDPVGEAKMQFDSMDLVNVGTIYVYGVGAGYFYDIVEPWLREHPERFVVFLEDDLEVIHRLLETERGKKILTDRQVMLQYFPEVLAAEKLWVKLARYFAIYDFRLSVSEYYKNRRPPHILEMLQSKISFWSNIFRAVLTEYRNYGVQFYTNFYSNLLFMPEAYRTNNLFGKFVGVPAIICGAGPSLDKNLAILETLADRAIIFAGGTSLNAVNSRGFVPHLGLGIDPNVDHQNRVIMNTAYELPYIYRSRINNGVLHLVHSQKLYTTGSGGYDTTDWYEKELDIQGLKVQEGFNVVNFSLSLAYEMGCNPIIFVGLDLAYSENRSYCSGVLHHAIHIRKKAMRTKTSSEELVLKRDINGNPVHTLWKWVSESVWLSNFAHTHRHVLFINATEGGLGIPGVANRPLADIADYLLTKSSDLRVRLHGEIQNSHMPPHVTKDKIIDLSKKLQESISRCSQYCEQLKDINNRLAALFAAGEEVQGGLESPEIKEILENLHSEDAYTYLLNEFDAHSLIMTELKKEQAKVDPDLTPNQANSKIAMLESGRYKFLKEALDKNIEIMLSSDLAKPQNLDSAISIVAAPPEFSEGDSYSFNDYLVTMIDPELDLNITETEPLVSFKDVNELYYNSGIIKFQQYFYNNRLHGPVTYFAESGQVLARSWYIKGVQEGKAHYYYHTGELYSLQRYRNGMQDGLQQYYYQTGRVKATLNYRKGLLNGDVNLYYPDGKKMRELHFVDGKRNGLERMWNKFGQMIIEAEYKHDNAVGIARTWFDNGQMAREIVYDDIHLPVTMRRWYENGAPIPEEEGGDDFFDKVTLQTVTLTRSLEQVFETLSKLAPMLTKETELLRSSFESLKQRIENLSELNEKLFFESGLHPGNPKEPLWKTPASQRDIQLQLGEVTQKLTNDVIHLQQMIKNLGKKQDEKG